ncbi:MAG: hypothetical protein ACT4QF_07700 [Sporichthyaceae bacterium]
MSDMALRKPVTAGRATTVKKKHKGETSDAMRVLGQTAAVAGISGALLLSLKAMVLVAPAVLPSGSGLDALGRPAPGVASVDDLAAPVAIGRVVNDAFAAPAQAPRVSGVSERNAETVGRGSSSSNGGSTTAPGQSGGNTGNTGNSGSNNGSGNNNSGGGSKPAAAQTGAVGGVVGSLGGVLDGVVPGVGSTLGETTKPVTGAVDGLTSSLGLDKVVGGVTDSLGVTKTKTSGQTSEKSDGVLGDTLAPVTDTVSGLTGSLLGSTGGSSKSLLGGLGLG